MTDNKKIFFIAKMIKKETYSRRTFLENNKEWTKDEDNLLISLAESINLRKKWVFLEKYFPGKSSLDLYSRYLKINPQIKKGKWTKEENEKLKNLVDIFGFNWSLIAKLMKNRNCKQIRSHYENYLKENLDLNKSFTIEEDERLIKFSRFLGNKWTKYIEYFPDRSSKMIENRVNMLHKKQNIINDKCHLKTNITESTKFSNFYKLNLSIDETDYVSVFVFM